MVAVVVMCIGGRLGVVERLLLVSACCSWWVTLSICVVRMLPRALCSACVRMDT